VGYDNALTQRVIGCAVEVHRTLGPGLLEGTHEECLAPVMAGLDPAIGYPQPIANDAIPVSNHPMQMTGSARS